MASTSRRCAGSASRASRPRRGRSTARTSRRAGRWARSARGASPTARWSSPTATPAPSRRAGTGRRSASSARRARRASACASSPCETRPVLQGARLTAWELARDGFDVTLITDSMVAQLMRRGGVDLVVVGADRIARTADVANKIGTYGVACLAAAPRRAVLRGRALEHGRPRVPGRRRHPHRAAERARGPRPSAACAIAPEGVKASTTRPSTSRRRG